MTMVTKWRAWDRRALTILNKAEALMLDMVSVLGEEDDATDIADDAYCTAQNLAEMCARQVKAQGKLK